MILDKLTEVSSAQAITATAVSASSYDRGAAAAGGPGTTDAGEGTPLALVVTIGAAFNTLTSLDIEGISSTDDILTAGIVTVVPKKTVLLAQLSAGNTIFIGVVQGPTKRYLGARYTVTGSNPSTGTITARFIPYDHRQSNPPSLT